MRRAADALTRGVVQLASLGYAVPGAVIVVGLLSPVGWLQAARPDWGAGYWVTTTVLGIVWAYLVRFCCGGIAIRAKRLCAHAAQLGRLGAHAGQ